jgi:hypothetical protein
MVGGGAVVQAASTDRALTATKVRNLIIPNPALTKILADQVHEANLLRKRSALNIRGS